MVAADARTAENLTFSPSQAGDVPEGRKPLPLMPTACQPRHLIMDRAYEGGETRQLVPDLGFEPVVPPKKNRLKP